MLFQNLYLALHFNCTLSKDRVSIYVVVFDIYWFEFNRIMYYKRRNNIYSLN